MLGGKQPAGSDLGPGSRVLIYGLQATPQFNHMSGQIQRFDRPTGRWLVKLSQRVEGQDELLTKSDNLMLAENVYQKI